MTNSTPDSGGPSRWPSIKRRLHALLTHRRMPVFVAVLAGALALPSLWVGWAADDYHHRLRLLGAGDFLGPSGSSLDLFRFTGRDLAQNLRLIDVGVWPWWTLPEIKAAFFRPIAAATHWLDYALWPDQAALMHLHSVLWFAALAAVVAVLYRQLIGLGFVAGLAALLYAVDDARGMPVGFLANRNALIAGFFGVLAIIAHDRWRGAPQRTGGVWRAGAVAGPLLLGAALFSAEGGLAAAAYLLAHALFLDRGKWPQRLAVLLPYVAVVLGWRIVWTHLGCGVRGISLYVDPLTDPVGYLSALIERVPILLVGQWLLLPSDLYLTALDVGVIHLYAAGAAAILVVLAVVIGPWLRLDAMTRFWGVGMILALLPMCACFPADRLLCFVGLGAFPVIAGVVTTILGKASAATTAGPHRARRLPAKVVAVVLIGIHAGLAPVGLAARSAMPLGPPEYIDNLFVTMPPDADLEGKTVIIVTAPMPLVAGYLPERRALDGLSIPAHTRALAPYDSESVLVTRPDTRTLVVRPAKGYLYLGFDRLARADDHPMSLGQRVELTGMTAEVTALTAAGRPAEVAFRFATPLEDPSLIWLHWTNGSFAPFPLPAVGGTVDVGHRRAAAMGRGAGLSEAAVRRDGDAAP